MPKEDVMTVKEALAILEDAKRERAGEKAIERQLGEAWQAIKAEKAGIPDKRAALVADLAMAAEEYSEAGVDRAKQGLADLAVADGRLRVRAGNLVGQIEEVLAARSPAGEAGDLARATLSRHVQELQALLAEAFGQGQARLFAVRALQELRTEIEAFTNAG